MIGPARSRASKPSAPPLLLLLQKAALEEEGARGGHATVRMLLLPLRCPQRGDRVSRQFGPMAGKKKSVASAQLLERSRQEKRHAALLLEETMPKRRRLSLHGFRARETEQGAWKSCCSRAARARLSSQWQQQGASG
jgi:hypothetical protein